MDFPSFGQLRALTLSDDHLTCFKPFRIGEAPKLATLNMCGEFESVNFFLLDTNMPPSVRHLSITSMFLKMGDLHSTSITRLCLGDVYVKSDDFAKFPVFFPLLEELILSLDGPGIPIIGIPVVLPNLKTLGIGILNEFPMVDMTTPRLTRLFMKNGN